MKSKKTASPTAVIGSGKLQINNKSPLLELPEMIRRKIYLKAGLPTKQAFSFNHIMWPVREFFEYNIRGFDTDTPFSLMSTCRLIYEEMSKIMYRENTMIITRSAPGGLRALDRLTMTSLGNLRKLVIKLNVCTSTNGCHEFFDQLSHRESAFAVPQGDRPLGDDGAVFATINYWVKLCNQLSKVLQADQLSLHVWCDCKTLEIARKIAEPMNCLPLLKDCTLRLAHHLDPAIRQLARDTVASLTKSSPIESLVETEQAKLDFFMFPVEVQQKILNYAVYRRTNGESIEIHDNKLKFGRYCDEDDFVLRDIGRMYERAVCVCERKHSAASNGRCNCADTAPRTAVFLVNHAFRELAIRAFYSQHKFTILTNRFDQISQAHRLPVSEPTSKVIPAKGITNTAWNDWRNTIDKLVKHANLATLLIEIRFPDVYDSGDPEVARHGPPPATRPSAAHMKRVQEFYKKLFRIAMPLGKNGLKSLVVYLVRTQDYRSGDQINEGEDDYDNYEGENGPKSEARVTLETQLEKMVMGPEWDAFASGGKKIRGYFF